MLVSPGTSSSTSVNSTRSASGRKRQRYPRLRSPKWARRTGQINRLLGIVRDFCSVGSPGSIAGQHDVPTPGKQAWQALEGLAAHDHRCSHRQCLEPLEVGRKVPRQRAVAPDHAVLARATTIVICGLFIALCRCRVVLPSALMRFMTEGEAQLIEAARQGWDPRAVITDPRGDRAVGNRLAGRVHGAAPAILAPGSTEEVAEIVSSRPSIACRWSPRAATRAWLPERHRQRTERQFCSRCAE